jgi:hypothetical protein
MHSIGEDCAMHEGICHNADIIALAMMAAAAVTRLDGAAVVGIVVRTTWSDDWEDKNRMVVHSRRRRVVVVVVLGARKSLSNATPWSRESCRVWRDRSGSAPLESADISYSALSYIATFK